MSDTINEIIKKAKEKSGWIVLPEANQDVRVLDATKQILSQGICDIIVLGKPSEFPAELKNNPHCKIVEIDNVLTEQFAKEFQEMRKFRGYEIEFEDAKKTVSNPIYFAMMMLHDNMASGVVAGAKESTANVLRPALQIIRAKQGKSTVTGSMILTKGNKTFLFGDVSLVQFPNEQQLCEIAISNAEFMKNVLSTEPRVALLSYSTKGSAKSDSITMIQKATELAQHSKYQIDGEMQVDSALDRATALHKGVSSSVGGNANVLIFPDLNAGNIGYKLVARLAGYKAIGPVMLNFNKPVNDLSRGCTAEEILLTVCITKLQA